MRARRRPDGLHAVHLFEIVPEHGVVEFQSFRFVRRGDDEIRRVRVRADVGGGETRNHGEEFHAVALRDADAIQRFEIILMMRDADDRDNALRRPSWASSTTSSDAFPPPCDRNILM